MFMKKMTMRSGMKKSLVLCAALILSSMACKQSSLAQGTEKKLSIDRLYSLPWVTGARPLDPVWSPDSKRIAFLWNNEGNNFYDIWIADAASGKPIRVTAMPHELSTAQLSAASDTVNSGDPEGPGVEAAKLAAEARVDNDHGVSSVQWTRDGKQLIFAFHGQLYRIALNGFAEKPQRLLDGFGAQSLTAVAPIGNRLVCVIAGALWVVNLDETRPSVKKLYDAARNKVGVEELHWSHDGRSIAFVEADASRVPTRGIPDYLGFETRLNEVERPFPGEPSEMRRLGVIAADGDATTRWVELGADPLDLIFGIAWSPDSRTLLVDKSDLYIKDRRLLLADAATGHAKELLHEHDAKNVTAEWWSDWTPDGKGVYFISDRGNDYHVYYEALAGGEPKAITAGNWAVFSAEVSPAAHALFVVTNEGRTEERHLYRVPFEGGVAAQRITQRAGTHTPAVSPDGQQIVDLFSDDLTPPDLYLQGTVSESGRQLTHSPLPEFSQYHWVAAKYVQFPNVHDGATLHGRLTLPPGFDPKKKYPAILGSVYSNTVHNQWGGRIFHPTWGLDQYLAQQGYVILNVDISGSSGYGKNFRQRICEDYGGVDVEDLYSGVRYLVAQGYVDEQRVGIWGSSYGGLLTSMSLFKHPGVYKVGIAGAPATSLFHALTGEMRTMMAPQDHEKQYAAASSYLHSNGLQDHLMLIHGMRDDTVLFKDSVTLEQRLILAGKDVDLLVLPDAPHGWDTEGMAQTRYAYKKMVDYFARYLSQGPTRE